MIDSRIETVLKFVEQGSRVADVGADHGGLSIELVKRRRSAGVIATEKNSAPFDALRKNILAAGLSSSIEVRQGDGLKILSAGEVDTICIAGMGGALIAKILADSPEVTGAARRLILQPMNAAEKIFSWAEVSGWIVEDSDLAKAAGIIYEIFSLVKVGESVSRPLRKFSSPLYSELLTLRADKLRRILGGISKSSTDRAKKKFFEVQSELDQIESELQSSNCNIVPQS